jgi:hypothetical protein
MNSRVRVTFETDAANDYFKRPDEPGVFELYQTVDGERELASSYQRPRLLNGLAHLSLSLPDDAKEGDELSFQAVITDPSRVEPFCNTFVLSVKAERDARPGPPGKRNSAGRDTGLGKGAKGKGQDGTQDSFLDIPDPIHVYEKDWKTHDPAFDKFTAIRIRRQPGTPENEDKYDYYINMDNVYLQTYLKAQLKRAPGLKLRFSVGMTLVALAVLHQEQLRQKGASASEDMPEGKVEVHERVAQTTAAMAPFLLPMIESVSALDDKEDYFSESAGEAA